MGTENILAMVLAGGKDTRLFPLPQNLAKPAVLFGGSYRLVDFALSNLVNSGISSIYLLAQHKPESLMSHIQDNWDLFSAGMDGFVRVVQPGDGGDYLGTADAVRKNLVLIERHAPSMVMVLAADHIFRLDMRQMVDFHRARNADATVLATTMPIESASAFCNISVCDDGEIISCRQGAEYPGAMPCLPGIAQVSTGNYLFNTEVLVEALENSLSRVEVDFGRDILPGLVRSHNVYAYDLGSNHVPGLVPGEVRVYWREVGTLEDYAAAHRDIAGKTPRFNLQNLCWPILPARFSPPQSSKKGDSFFYVGQLHMA